MKRVVVVVNKKWEIAPILAVLRAPFAPGSHASAKPPAWETPPILPEPWPDSTGTYDLEFRNTLQVGGCRVELWCLADFADTSISTQKVGYIPLVLQGSVPDLVIAVGTAASVTPSQQGSVIVGTRAFIFDSGQNQEPLPSNWPATLVGKLIESSFHSSFERLIRELPAKWWTDMQSRMLLPIHGESAPAVHLDAEFTAVGDVNVDNPAEYNKFDRLAIAACRAADPGVNIGSIETTSALIRAMTDPVPYLFLSGIVNDLGEFSRDVLPNEYAQNFAGSHNAGVVLAWLLAYLTVC